MTDDLRARITDAVWDEARTIGSTLSLKASGLIADAVIRQLDADYVLVPKSHTLARIAANKLTEGAGPV